MDYSKLSDDEIASKVLIAQGYKLIDDGYGYSIYISDCGRKDIGPKASKKFVFDPCKNPVDAWPIIEESGICISYDGISWDASCPLRDIKPVSDWRDHPYSPFRMAMIVFLMMQGE